ncbi:MAG: peptidylprolyl isomerase [Proteobacteria bacterium]|nr:peptidylprolyl isomerase [Pseudomonadota bacterium]
MNFLFKFFLFFFISTSVFGEDTIPLDRVVAIVGDGVITELELNKEITLTRQSLVNSGASAPDLIYLRQQVLERIITRKVLTNLADRTGIRVSDDEVGRALQRIAQQNNSSVEDYIRAIEQNDLSGKRLRETIVDETKILKLRRREVEAKLIVNDSEIKSYLDQMETGISEQNESLIAHILIAIAENATPEDLRKAQDNVAEAISKIDEGVDFRQVAAELSDATDALEGGVMGWRDQSNLPDLFIQALSKMRIGQRSDVLRSSNGFHIVYLLDKRGRDAQIIVQQTLARHILFRVDRIVSDEDALIKATEVRNRVVIGGEDFETLAKLTSDDPSGSNGGVLNWLMPGETVPEFEQALARLAIGEVSEPVRTQFGYHLIEVLDRRDSDVSEARQIEVARQALTQKKLAFRFEEWIREVRDTTFIKYVN